MLVTVLVPSFNESGNVEPLVRELDPARLMLQTYCGSRDEAEKLLEQSVAWTRHARTAT